MENAQTHRSVAAFQRRQSKTQKNLMMGNAVLQESLAIRRRSRRGVARRRMRRRIGSTVKMEKGGAGAEEVEKEEVEGRISALQRIVPGGVSLGIERLLDETADYIVALEGQLKGMRALACFFEGLEKESRKLGG